MLLNRLSKLKKALLYPLFLGLFLTCIFLLNEAANKRQLIADTLTLSRFDSNISPSAIPILKNKIL